MQKNKLSDFHFSWNTGYGYDDAGREVTEKIFADTFGAEKALVRTQMVNGTHALSLIFTGLLRPGDELIYCSGSPYDTLEEVIGVRGSGMGSLADFEIGYKFVNLTKSGEIDFKAIEQSISPRTKMLCLQRSKGYAWRPSLKIDEIAAWISFCKALDPNIICMVDNCYGEFIEELEPTDIGVDIMAGSLIKNPGGGLALSGGYVVGKSDLIDKISYSLTCPGIGGECGLTFGQTRTILQGLFMAPTVVSSAIKGAILCSETYRMLGFKVSPLPEESRSDIIQAVRLKSPEALIAFCEGIQSASPVDSHVRPMPSDMPGYDVPVIMAAGTFVQGSSIELSADGPLKTPYNVYFQGGLTYEASKLGIIKSIESLKKRDLLNGKI